MPETGIDARPSSAVEITTTGVTAHLDWSAPAFYIDWDPVLAPWRSVQAVRQKLELLGLAMFAPEEEAHEFLPDGIVRLYLYETDPTTDL